MIEKFIQFLLSEDTGKRVGMLIGFVVGLSIVIFGLTETLIITSCMLLGTIIGMFMDRNYSGLDGVKRLFRKKQ